MSDFLSAGRLEDHPFAALTGLIFQEGRGGELTVESGNRRRRVWFLGGNPVAVVSDDDRDHVAQVLLEHGKIGEEEARLLAELPETREGLEGASFVAKEVISWGVKIRFVNLCYDLFRWEDGDYAFRESPPPRVLFLLKVPAHSLVFKGVGFMSPTSLLGSAPDEAVLGPGTVDADQVNWLGADERRLLGECRAGRSVGDVLAGVGEDADQTRRLLFALSCLGLTSLGQAVSGDADSPLEIDEPGLDEPDLDEPPPLEDPLDLAPPQDEFPEPAPPPPAEAPWDSPGPQSDDTGSIADQPTAAGFGFDDGSSDAAAGFQAPDADPFGPAAGSDETGAAGSLGADLGFGSSGSPLYDEEPPEGDDEEDAGARRRFALPRLALIAGGALVAAGVIGSGLWWYLGSGDAPNTAPPPMKQVAVPPPAPPPTERTAAQYPVPPPSPTPRPEGTTSAGSPEPAPSPVPPPTAAVTVPPPLSTPTPAPAPVAPAPPATSSASSPEPATAPLAEPAGSSERYRAGFQVFANGDFEGAAAIWESELEDHSGASTVLLMTACERGTVQSAFTALAGHGPLFLVGKDVNGRRCYRVSLGTYGSKAAASKALAALPGEYRAAGATVRRITDILAR